MKVLKLLSCLFLLYAPCGYSVGVYELTGDLYFNLGNPERISYLPPSVVISYDNMAVLHEIISPESIYPNIDLSPQDLVCSIRNMIKHPCHSKLDERLKSLSDSQAIEHEKYIGKINFSKRSLGQSDIFTSYYNELNYGEAYIIANDIVHHITITKANQKQFNQFFNDLKKEDL